MTERVSLRVTVGSAGGVHGPSVVVAKWFYGSNLFGGWRLLGKTILPTLLWARVLRPLLQRGAEALQKDGVPVSIVIEEAGTAHIKYTGHLPTE